MVGAEQAEAVVGSLPEVLARPPALRDSSVSRELGRIVGLCPRAVCRDSVNISVSGSSLQALFMYQKAITGLNLNKLPVKANI